MYLQTWNHHDSFDDKNSHYLYILYVATTFCLSASLPWRLERTFSPQGSLWLKSRWVSYHFHRSKSRRMCHAKAELPQCRRPPLLLFVYQNLQSPLGEDPPCSRKQKVTNTVNYKDLDSFQNTDMTKHIYIIFLLKIRIFLLPKKIENPLCNLAKIFISVTVWHWSLLAISLFSDTF